MPESTAPVLLVAAHGTRSDEGTATTHALVDAVRARANGVDVRLCFLDVATPSLADALDELGRRPTVVVPLQLSAGYHVHTDIPPVVAGRDTVRVTEHLGPDPLLITALAERLEQARGDAAPAASTVLAGVGSSRASARADLELAAARLAERLGRPVEVLAVDDTARDRLARLPRPVEVAAWLLAPGTFEVSLRRAAAGLARVSEPMGTHPALVELILARYRAALEAGEPAARVG